MVSPAFLKKGDKIAIVAPARKVSKLEMMPAIKKLSDWGLQVVLGSNLFGVNNQYSGTDEERIADFQEMLDDKSIKAIISARGGYGSIRLIEKLRFYTFFENPKWIIGYSDITIFHSFLHINNTQSIHATMPINFPVDGSDNESNGIPGGLRQAGGGFSRRRPGAPGRPPPGWPIWAPSWPGSSLFPGPTVPSNRPPPCNCAAGFFPCALRPVWPG